MGPNEGDQDDPNIQAVTTDDQNEASWQYNPDASNIEGKPKTRRAAAAVAWSAPEFVEHDRSPVWYGGFIGVTIVVVAGVYFLAHDLVAAVSLSLIATIFLIGISRKPRELDYQIDERSIRIGSKTYGYGAFKSFYVMPERTGGTSIGLLPLKRFMPLVALNYPPEQEEKIVATLSQYLPLEQHKNDLIDTIAHRLGL